MQNNRSSQLLFVVFLIFSQCTCVYSKKQFLYLYFFFCYKRVQPRFTADCPFNRGCQAFPRSLLSIFTVVTACCLFSLPKLDCPFSLLQATITQTVPYTYTVLWSSAVDCPFKGGCQAFPRSLLSIFTSVTACCLAMAQGNL